MAWRSKTFVILASLAGLTAVLLLIGFLKSGGLATPLNAPPDTRLASASAMPGVRCEKQLIPVQLSPGGWLHFDVVGELCSTGEPDGRVLQVLVSGSGYGSIYWDFPLPAGYLLLCARGASGGFRDIQFLPAGHGRK